MDREITYTRIDREDEANYSDCVDLTNWSLWRKEKVERRLEQCRYFTNKIRDIRLSLNPHFQGHTYMDTEECRREFEEYDEVLQEKFRHLDYTLGELERLLNH
jgi:hypothetical protein